MRLNTHNICLLIALTFGGTALGQNYFDDVYYNPKKDKSATVSTTTKKTTASKSSYIADMADMDVDEYNRRGQQYYVSEIDTIGSVAENGEDFVYTQQIQKYYNPTIVVENANVLEDVLTNARGNVEIVINDYGNPVFAPYGYYGWNWPYYSAYWSPWNWGLNFGPWGWSVGWGGPWLSWTWGPAWGPAWGPGWGPGWWNPGPGWGPGPGPGGPGWRPGPMATWNPGGNRPVAPRPGWSAPNPPRGNAPLNSRPVGNYRGSANGGNVSSARPAQSAANVPTRGGVVKQNGRWQYNSPVNPMNRPATNNGAGVTTNRGNRYSSPLSNTVNGNSGSVTNNSSNSSKSPSVSPNRTTNRGNSSSYSRPASTGTSRSTGGGSRSGGGSRGGGGGGRHR